MDVDELLDSEVKVINIGLEDFARHLKERGVAVVHLDWAPPAGGDPRIRDLLAKLGS